MLDPNFLPLCTYILRLAPTVRSGEDLVVGLDAFA